MAKGAVQVVILGKAETKDFDKAQRQLNSMRKAAGDTGASMGLTGKQIGAAFALAGAAATKYGIDSVRAFAESEKQAAKLRQTMEAAGQSWDVYGAQVDSAVKSMMMLGAYEDEELNAGLARLTQTTGDVTSALDLMSLAMDVARGTGKPLEDTAVMLGKVQAGNIGVLKRYGITLDGVSTSEQALAELQRRFAGQAEAYGDSAAGSIDKITIALGEMQESFGGGLMEGIGDNVKDATANLEDMVEVAGVVGQAVGGVFDIMLTGSAQVADGIYWLTETIGGWDTASKMMWDAWIDQGGEATMTFGEFRTAVDEGTIKIDGLQVASGKAQGSAADLAGAVGDVGAEAGESATAMEELTRAMDGTKVAADSLQGKERTLAEMENDRQQGVYAAKDAQEAYNEAVKEHGPNSDEAAEASLRLQDANWKAGDATADLRAKEVALGDTLDTIAQKKAAEEWLAGIRDRAREAAAAVGNVMDQSNRSFGSGNGGGQQYKGHTKYGSGGKVYGPELAEVGERGHLEYVITTESVFRDRSLDLYAELGRDLGIAKTPQAPIQPLTVNFMAPVRTYSETVQAMQDIERGIVWS